jgi:lysophospholipase L1-like esterase
MPPKRWRISINYDKKQSNSIVLNTPGGWPSMNTRGLTAFIGWCLLCPDAFAQSTAALSFDFAPGGNAGAHPLYDAQRAFGFEANAPGNFSVRVPEGNYRVTVRFGSGRATAHTTVEAEQRRLMLESVDALRGKTIDRSFIINVRTPALGALPANAPGGTAVQLKPREFGSNTWDEKLTVEFSGDIAAVRSMSIAPVAVPTLYLAGDSTVTDQATAPSASWGQKLPRFFAPDIAVANHAESGETLKSFVTELRLDKLLSKLAAGDWVMIQFGHNDQKAQWPQTYAEAATTYRAWLRTYIAEVRRRGATPILVTSPERRNFDAAGRIVPSLGDYPDAMRATAKEESVALIDLNSLSVRFYEALGPEKSPRAFADQGRDKTHHNNFGAYDLARLVVEGLRGADAKLSGGLAAHLAPDVPRFDPDHPAAPPSTP